MPIIALLTDFGTHDPYVGEMKAEILRINPAVAIVDLTHEIPPFSISTAAYFLLRAARTLPDSSIIIYVIDPGVGTRRRGIIVRCSAKWFIGPDNGCLTWVCQTPFRAYRILENRIAEAYGPLTHTFHGRDVFARVAALLSLGWDQVEPFVELVDSITLLDYPKTYVEEGRGVLDTAVVHIDRFGNVILSATPSDLSKAGLHTGDQVEIQIHNRQKTAQVVTHYGEIPAGLFGLVASGEPFLEISLYMKSAAKALHAKVGDRVRVVATKTIEKSSVQQQG